MDKNLKNAINYYMVATGSFVWEVAKVVIISLAIILPVRYYIIQPFYVKGSSMEPTFYDYEYLIINEIGYRFNEPAESDVIVLKDPRHTSQYFIKRIIGVPGDTVKVDNGKVFVNGEQLDESAYLDDSVYTDSAFGNDEITLGVDQYYVMGDNRPASYDSRRFGAVDRSEIIGKVWIRAWPFSRLDTFK